VVQQTMVFIAQLAMAGGVRAPLASVAERVFLDLTTELQNRGVTKNVIADMFGMALRTYHRRVRELEESKTDLGHSVWEGVLGFIRLHGPVSGHEVLTRFAGDDPEVVAGVLAAATMRAPAQAELPTAVQLRGEEPRARSAILRLKSRASPTRPLRIVARSRWMRVALEPRIARRQRSVLGDPSRWSSIKRAPTRFSSLLGSQLLVNCTSSPTTPTFAEAGPRARLSGAAPAWH
jgi:hypothetical protein